MAGTLKVGGNTIATHIGVEGAGTVSANNVSLGNNVQFPAGHVISHSIPFFSPGIASPVQTDSTSFQESGFEVSLTTKLSSINSRIIVQFYTGYVRTAGSASSITIWTAGRSTATSTTYSSATDLSNDQSSYFYPGATGTYWTQHSTWIDQGTYSANTTYYYQIYFRSYNTNMTRLTSQGGAVSLLAYEVKI